MKPLLRLGFSIALTLGTAAPAFADDRAACLDAASRGQSLRDQHQTVAARDAFRSCARRECPRIVQKDCAAWLDSAEANVPTLVLGAKDGAGADLVTVTVTLDGKPFATRLDGTAVEIDPGPHVFRFEIADGTRTERQVLVREGSKNQSVSVVLHQDAPAPPVAKRAEERAPAAPAPSPAHRSGARTLGLALAGVGGAGLVAGGVFWGLGAAAWGSAQNECPSHRGCSAQATDDRSSAVSWATASTVGFLAGGVILAGGLTLLLTAPKRDSVAVGMKVGPRGLAIAGTF